MSFRGRGYEWALPVSLGPKSIWRGHLLCFASLPAEMPLGSLHRFSSLLHSLRVSQAPADIPVHSSLPGSNEQGQGPVAVKSRKAGITACWEDDKAKALCSHLTFK